MRSIAMFARIIAFLFNLALGLGLFFLALLVIAGGQHTIQLSAVPLKGSTLTYSLLGASIFLFVAIVLALRKGRGARFPMLAWNILVAVLLLTAPLRSSFSFQNPDHMMTGVYVFLASLAALWGSWLQWKARV